MLVNWQTHASIPDKILPLTHIPARSKPTFKPVGVGTAGAVLRPIAKFQNVFSILDSLEFDDLIQPDNFGTMNTGKSGWVKPFLQRAHRFTQEMGTIPCV